MSKFYKLFPTIQYDIAKDGTTKFDTITDITLRLGVLNEVKNNTLSYYDYIIREQDTPENLADRLYGDAEYHWVILLMNDIINPMFDWPLKSDAFASYIINKYGSIENAKTTIHHYEKVITRTDLNSGTYNEIQMQIDQTAYDALPDSSYEDETLSSGRTISVNIIRRIVYCYDWENDVNETKRNIKLLKKQYLGQVMSNLASIMRDAGAVPNTSRRIVR